MGQTNQLRTHRRSGRERRGAGASSAFFDAIRTRALLAAERRPAHIKGPPIRHLLGELGSLTNSFGRADKSALKIEPAAEPRVVMLLPGFGTHPVRMRHMAQELERAGHTVKRWGLGFNLGPTPENFAAVVARVLALHRRHKQKIVLVGWSLGGLFAREIAKCQPDAVAKVITMGSPFSGDPRANNAWRIYQLITGHSVAAPPVVSDMAVKPPVPTVALWSPRDGIVSPRSSCGRKGERDRAIALRCSHLAFAYSDEAIGAVLHELDTLN